MSTTASATRRPVTALAATVALGVGMSLLAVPAAHAVDVPTTPNPKLSTDICGLDVVLAIDASNSIRSGTGRAINDPRVLALKATALKIASSFTDKNTRLSVVSFSNDVKVEAGLTSVTGQSVGSGGAISNAINGYKSGQGTNWEGAFDSARSVLGGARGGVGKLVLFMSDGRPNAWNGHPNPGAVNNVTRAEATDHGTTAANALKTAVGARVLAIGFGDALDPDNANYKVALQKISGPTTVSGNATPDVRTDDVVLQSNFTALASQLSSVAAQAINNHNCSFLSVTPSKGTVAYKKAGRPVALTARLTAPGTSGIAGQNVTMYQRVGSAWKSMGAKRTDSLGRATWPTRVTANQAFYATFGGSATSNSTQSGAISVLVAPKVKTKVSKTSLGRHSALMTFSGKLKPKTIKKLFLQRLDHGVWTTVAKKKAKNGKYTVVQVVTKKKSKWRIATKRNASYTVGYSKVFKVKV